MYTRGQFSHIARISMKALRLYDELGLLKPGRVDTANGYRYYSRTQLTEVAQIQEWRRYGFTLQDMLELQQLADKEEGRAELRGRLCRRQGELEAEVEEKRLIIGELAAREENLARPGEQAGLAAADYRINLGLAGGLSLLSCRQMTAVQDAGQLVGKLYEALFAQSLTALGGHLLIYHQEGYEPDSADLEAGLPVHLPDSGFLSPAELVRFPERLCASTRHHGSFSRLGLAHAAVLDWIWEHGYEPDGPPFEHYDSLPLGRFHPASVVTNVFYPVRSSHEPAAIDENAENRGGDTF